MYVVYRGMLYWLIARTIHRLIQFFREYRTIFPHFVMFTCEIKSSRKIRLDNNRFTVVSYIDIQYRISCVLQLRQNYEFDACFNPFNSVEFDPNLDVI